MVDQRPMEPPIIESTGPVISDDPALQVLIVGIPWKLRPHAGFIIQLGYGDNDDGWGYCIDTEDQVTHYGGIVEFDPEGSDWRFRLEPNVALDMGLPPTITVRFDAAATDLAEAADLIRRMLGHPRRADDPHA